MIRPSSNAHCTPRFLCAAWGVAVAWVMAAGAVLLTTTVFLIIASPVAIGNKLGVFDELDNLQILVTWPFLLFYPWAVAWLCLMHNLREKAVNAISKSRVRSQYDDR